jgi:hypothetical protein
MKKTLLLAAALVLASAAQATTVGASYDLDRANGDGFRRANELRVTIAQPTKYGTFDAALTGARFNGVKNHDDANGFEVGYSDSLAVTKALTLTGRAGYGRLNNIDGNGGGYTGNSSYYVLQAEAATPVAKNLGAFVGYRFRSALNADTTTQNRYTIGADYALTKSVAVRAAYNHTRQAGLVFNGATVGATYSF